MSHKEISQFFHLLIRHFADIVIGTDLIDFSYKSVRSDDFILYVFRSISVIYNTFSVSHYNKWTVIVIKIVFKQSSCQKVFGAFAHFFYKSQMSFILRYRAVHAFLSERFSVSCSAYEIAIAVNKNITVKIFAFN